MGDREVKIFVTVVASYFVMRDVGALVMYSRKKDSLFSKLRGWLKGSD